MYKYFILISWSEDDNCYLVSVPDLPGCMADGETPIEVFKEIEIAKELWIETALEESKKIPEPHLFSMPV